VLSQHRHSGLTEVEGQNFRIRRCLFSVVIPEGNLLLILWFVILA